MLQSPVDMQTVLGNTLARYKVLRNCGCCSITAMKKAEHVWSGTDLIVVAP